MTGAVRGRRRARARRYHHPGQRVDTEPGLQLWSNHRVRAPQLCDDAVRAALKQLPRPYLLHQNGIVLLIWPCPALPSDAQLDAALGVRLHPRGRPVARGGVGALRRGGRPLIVEYAGWEALLAPEAAMAMARAALDG